MTGQPILTSHDLSKSFAQIKAVRGVALEVYSGEAFGLLGPNGAGKTTIIGMILGLIRPTAGTWLYGSVGRIGPGLLPLA